MKNPESLREESVTKGTEGFKRDCVYDLVSEDIKPIDYSSEFPVKDELERRRLKFEIEKEQAKRQAEREESLIRFAEKWRIPKDKLDPLY